MTNKFHVGFQGEPLLHLPLLAVQQGPVCLGFSRSAGSIACKVIIKNPFNKGKMQAFKSEFKQ